MIDDLFFGGAPAKKDDTEDIPDIPSNSVWAEIHEHFGDKAASLDDYADVNLDQLSGFRDDSGEMSGPAAKAHDLRLAEVETPAPVGYKPHKGVPRAMLRGDDEWDDIAMSLPAKPPEIVPDDLDFEDLDSVAGLLEDDAEDVPVPTYKSGQASRKESIHDDVVNLIDESLEAPIPPLYDSEVAVGKMKMPSGNEKANRDEAKSKLITYASILFSIHIIGSALVATSPIGALASIVLNYIGIALIAYVLFHAYKRSSFIIHGLRAHLGGVDVIYSSFDSQREHVEFETVGWRSVLKVSKRSALLSRLHGGETEIEFILSEKMNCERMKFSVFASGDEASEFDSLSAMHKHWHEVNAKRLK